MSTSIRFCARRTPGSPDRSTKRSATPGRSRMSAPARRSMSRSIRWVLAIEPSEHRITSGTRGLTTPIRGYAEGLPIPSKSVDAAMACLTLHQWADWRVGVHELRRVARKRVAIFNGTTQPMPIVFGCYATTCPSLASCTAAAFRRSRNRALP